MLYWKTSASPSPGTWEKYVRLYQGTFLHTSRHEHVLLYCSWTPALSGKVTASALMWLTPVLEPDFALCEQNWESPRAQGMTPPPRHRAGLPNLMMTLCIDSVLCTVLCWWMQVGGVNTMFSLQKIKQHPKPSWAKWQEHPPSLWQQKMTRHCLMPLKRQNHGTLRSTKLPFSSESPETCVVILKRAAHGKKVDMPCFIMIGLKKYEWEVRGEKVWRSDFTDRSAFCTRQVASLTACIIHSSAHSSDCDIEHSPWPRHQGESRDRMWMKSKKISGEGSYMSILRLYWCGHNMLWSRSLYQ